MQNRRLKTADAGVSLKILHLGWFCPSGNRISCIHILRYALVLTRFNFFSIHAWDTDEKYTEIVTAIICNAILFFSGSG